MEAVVKFLREIRQETSKTTWPTKKEVLTTTAVVGAVVTVASVFFICVDYLVYNAIDFFLTLGG